jgi:transposase
MPPVSIRRREDIATRLNGGQTPRGIAEVLGISVSTIHRLKRQFRQQDGTYVAVAARRAVKQAFNREALVEIAQWLQENPKLTVLELRLKAVEEGLYSTVEDVPDQSTLYRQLKKMGFKWGKVRYSDPRSKRGVIQYERCAFRAAQDNGLDPTTLLSMDESNFHTWDQPRNAWGTTAAAATLEKPKGKTLRNAVYATVGFEMVEGDAKALINWVIIHPRNTWRPLPDTVQDFEIAPGEKDDIKTSLSPVVVKALSVAGLRSKLAELGIRSPENDRDSMQKVLLRVARRGSRAGELRVRRKGRPDSGGVLIPPTGDARMASEYLHECLVPFMRGMGLKNDDSAVCKLTADEGIQACPDGGRIEFRPGALSAYSILWDSAPSHLPSTHTHVSAFHKYAQEKLGLKGVVFTPPYSAWFNPVELFFSYTKRYIRKFAPATVAELVERLREATAKVTGDMIKGWYRKSGYLIPGEDPVEPPGDPNEGVADRCSLPRDATFQAREHIACFDSVGKLRREKKQGHRTWSKYDEIDTSDEDENDLENLSVSKRKAVAKKRRRRGAADSCQEPEEGKTRYTGIGGEPENAVHGDYSGLWQDHDDNQAVQAILDERTTRIGNKKKEYKVRWVGFDQSHDEWLPAERFTAGLNSLLKNWQERNKQREEIRQIQRNARAAAAGGGGEGGRRYRPDRRAKVGDIVAIYAGRTSRQGAFFMAKVLGIQDGKLRVHWWDSKNIDGTWSPQFRQPKGGKRVKGTAGPFVGLIQRESVIDRIPSLEGKKKGKIPTAQLREISRLVAEGVKS